MFTVGVFWRQLNMLKSGTVQSRPRSRNRLSTNPVVRRSAMPNKPYLKTGLDGSVAVALLTATPACQRGIPGHRGIEADRKRATTLERFIVG